MNKDCDKDLCVDTCEKITEYRATGEWSGETPSGKVTEILCDIPKCGRKAIIRGLCQSDYNRWYYGKIEHPSLGVFVKKGAKCKTA